MIPRPRLLAPTLCVLMAFAASSCSRAPAATVNASAPTPQRYVTSVCKTVLAWKDLLDVRSSSFVTEASSVQSPPGDRLLATYLSNVARDTDVMLTRVQAAGTPAYTRGSELRAILIQLLESVRASVSQVKTELTKLAQRGPAAFVGPIEGSVGTNVKAMRSALRSSGNTEITHTIVTDRNCKDLFEKSPVDLGA